MSKKEFEVKVEDELVKLIAVKPKAHVLEEGRAVYSTALTSLILKKQAIPRARVWSVLRENGTWDNEKEEKLRKIEVEIERLKKACIKGKNSNVLTDEEKEYALDFGHRLLARKIAIDLRRKRGERQLILLDALSLDGIVAENLAESEQMDYFTSQCILYADTYKPYFESVEDYKSQRDTEVAIQARTEFESLYYGLNIDNYNNELVENQLLLKYGFVNDKLELVDDKGNRVDVDWNPIVEDEELPDEVGDFDDDVVLVDKK